MKPHNPEQRSRRKQNAASRSFDKKKSKCTLERGTKLRDTALRDCDDFRRKTRLQLSREKRTKAVNPSVEFSEVSIQALHSICAPTTSHRQAKKSKLHLANISDGHKVFHQRDLGRSAFSLLSSSGQNTFCASEACSLMRAAYHGSGGAVEANAALQLSINAVEELWLEVSVEIDRGIDLVVDLNLESSTTEWLNLERISRLLVPPDKAAEVLQKRFGTDFQSHANDSSDVACLASGSSAEAPSSKHATSQGHDQLTANDSVMLDSDGGSKTAEMGVLAACIPGQSQESSTSRTKELRREEFSFASLERMPTFLTTGFGATFQHESKLKGTTDWMVVCMEV